MLISIRYLYFIFLNSIILRTALCLAQLDDSILLPDLTIDLPIQQLQFSAQTGAILQCDLQQQRDLQQNNQDPKSFNVQWLVYSFLEQRFVQLEDNELIKQINTANENYLSFLPFTSDQYNANVHNNFFRCIQISSKYKIAGHVVRVKARKLNVFFSQYFQSLI